MSFPTTTLLPQVRSQRQRGGILSVVLLNDLHAGAHVARYVIDWDASAQRVDRVEMPQTVERVLLASIVLQHVDALQHCLELVDQRDDFVAVVHGKEPVAFVVLFALG